MRHSFLVFIAVVTTACSTETIRKDSASADGGTTASPAPTSAASVSGTRLKARWLAAEDGARHLQGWHDTERDEQCSFQRAEDGKLRCLPLSAFVNTSWYADARCSRPLAYTSKGCDAPKTAALQESYCVSGASGGVRIFELGAPFRGANIYTKSGDSCTASPAETFLVNYVFYAVGAEIAPDAFVAAEETID